MSAECTWLEAAPFRAHVEHLMTAGGLPVSVIAVVAGVPERVLHQLLGGRGGRIARRINPGHAAALFAVTPATLQRLRTRTVPAAPTWAQLRRLRAAGWTDLDLAQALALPVPELRALVRLRTRRCSALTAARTTAAVNGWQGAGLTTPQRAA